MFLEYKKFIDITPLPDTTLTTTTTITDSNTGPSEMSKEDLEQWFHYYSQTNKSPDWMMNSPTGYFSTLEDVKKPKLPKKPFFCPLPLITKLTYTRSIDDNKFHLLDDLEMLLEYVIPVVEYSKGNLYLFDAKIFKEVRSRIEYDTLIQSAVSSSDIIAEAIENVFKACIDPLLKIGNQVPLREMTLIELHMFSLQQTTTKKLSKLVDTLLDCCWKLSNNRRLQREQIKASESFHQVYRDVNPWRVEMMSNPIMSNKLFYSNES